MNTPFYRCFICFFYGGVLLFNLDKFKQVVEQRSIAKEEIKEEIKQELVYIYECAVNQTSSGNIDFSRFKLEDVIAAFDSLTDSSYDDSAEHEYQFHADHPIAHVNGKNSVINHLYDMFGEFRKYGQRTKRKFI